MHEDGEPRAKRTAPSTIEILWSGRRGDLMQPALSEAEAGARAIAFHGLVEIIRTSDPRAVTCEACRQFV